MAYIIAFIPKNAVNEEVSNAIFLKKFRFKSFDENAYEELKFVSFENFKNNKILSVFLIDDDDKNTFVVLTCSANTRRRRNSKIIPPGDWLSLRKITNYDFKMKFYSNEIDELKDIKIEESSFINYQGEELFIKSLYLDNRLVSFIYHMENEDMFYVELFELNYKGSTNYISSKILEKIKITNQFDINQSLNEFVKINNRKLAFIYTSSSYICILIINININEFCEAICITNYNFETFESIEKLSGFSYNDYLLLAVTATPNENLSDGLNNYLSMFMILGYTKGIQIAVDKPELIDIELEQLKTNIFNFIYEDPIIENNIFGYSFKKEIKFFNIPDEIKVFIYIFSSNSIKQITNGYILCSDEETKEFCNNYDNAPLYELRIEINNEITSYPSYCFIEYQYLIEMDYNLKCSDNYDSLDSSSPISLECLYSEPEIYYGRKDTLKIKLCHEYCETCHEFSKNNDDQKCLSCLPDYQYDYLYYSNRAGENPNNCVPKHYYYDTEEDKLSLCSSTDYFFI